MSITPALGRAPARVHRPPAHDAGRPLAAPAVHVRQPRPALARPSAPCSAPQGPAAPRRDPRHRAPWRSRAPLVNVVLKRYLRPRAARPGEPAVAPPAAPRAGQPVLPERALVVGGGVRHRPGDGEPAGRRRAGAGRAGRRLLPGARGRALPGGRRRRAGRGRRRRGRHAALVAGAAEAPGAGARRRTRRPRCPEGEGLVVAVNPRSGPDDYDPAEDIERLLPRAEVLETTPEAGVDELLGEAARSGRAKALGRGRRRRQRRRGGRGRPRARPAAGRHRRGHPQPLRPGRRAGDPAGHRGRRRLRAGGARRRRRRQRDAVPQHLEHRRVPGDGRAAATGCRAGWASGWRSPWPRRRCCARQAPVVARGQRPAAEGLDHLRRQLPSTPRAGSPRPGARGWRTGCSTCSTCGPT